MPNEEITHEQAQYICDRVISDSTRWDLITAKELEKRIDAFLSDSANYDRIIDVVSGLRLAKVLYLCRKEKRGWSMPILQDGKEQIFLVFTSKRHMKSEKLKEYKIGKALFSEIVDSIGEENITRVIVNVDTQDLSLPVKMVMDFIQIFDDLEEMVDKKMCEGFVGKEMSAIDFERFKGRRIYCKTIDGKEIEGDAFSYGENNELGQYLELDISPDKMETIYKADVVFIKDITE